VQKALDALLDAWFKDGGSAEEAVEVMEATAKGLRRKYADRRPWAHALYADGVQPSASVLGSTDC
jgi:hypothetical protein